jgi:hypothetical protein
MSHRMIATLLALLGVLQPALAPVAAQGQREGIKVHGHWVIDLRNPDGTLASHTEFENSLDPGYGALGLAQILSREVRVTGWAVRLAPGSGFPFGGNPFQYSAAMFEPLVASHFGNSPSEFPSLTVAHPVGTTLFVLKGVATATGDGDIRRVHTELYAGIGNNPSPFPFTNAVLPTALRLAAGQIVQVTVTISFS